MTGIPATVTHPFFLRVTMYCWAMWRESIPMVREIQLRISPGLGWTGFTHPTTGMLKISKRRDFYAIKKRAICDHLVGSWPRVIRIIIQKLKESLKTN